MRANSDDFADAFVTADKWEFVRKWPVTLASVQVGVAYASAVHLDEALSWSELLWLLHRVVAPDADGCVGRYDDSGLLYSWDIRRHSRKEESCLWRMMKRRSHDVEHLYGRASSKWVQLDRAIELWFVVGKLSGMILWQFNNPQSRDLVHRAPPRHT